MDFDVSGDISQNNPGQTYDNETITQKYTAKEYLDSLIADTEEADDSRALGQAIMNYGSYVQPILAENNNWAIGVKHRKMTSAVSYTVDDFTSTAEGVAGHAISCDIPNDSGIADIQFSLRA